MIGQDIADRVREEKVLKSSAIVLGIVLGVAALYGVQTVITGGTDTSPSSILTVDRAECQITVQEGELREYEVQMVIRNTAGKQFNASPVAIYFRNWTELQEITVEGLDWSDKAFATGKNEDQVTVHVFDSVPGTKTNNITYDITIAFPHGSVDAGNCPRKEKDSVSNTTQNTSKRDSAETEQNASSQPTNKTGHTNQDQVPPTTTASINEGWSSIPQNIFVQCIDDKTGCRQIIWNIWDTSGNLLTNQTSNRTNTTILVGEKTDGLLELRYQGVDNAGNSEDWKIQEIRIDKQPPITAVSAADAWYSNDFTRFVADEAGGPSGLSYCEYRTQNGENNWSDWMQRSCRSVTVSVGQTLSNECTAEGTDTCRVEVRAWSRAGLNTTDSAVFNVDFEAPSTQITAPETDRPFNDSFRVTVADDSSSGFSSCEYRITDSVQGSTDWTPRDCPDGGFNVSVGQYEDCSTEGAGTCIVETRVTDNAGKASLDQAAYSINYTPESTDETNTTNSTDDDSTDNTTDSNSTNSSSDVDNKTWYKHTISSSGEWKEGTFKGTTVKAGALRIGYHDEGEHLVGFWRMENTAGSVQDYTGMGNEGTNNGAERGVSGVFGSNAFRFDRHEKDYVSIADDPSLDQDLDALTVSTWISFAEAVPSEKEVLVRKQRSGPFPYSLQREASGNIRISGEKFDVITSTAPLHDTQWHHIVATINTTHSQLYIDGTQNVSGFGGIIGDSSKPLFIGGDDYADRHYLSGTIDEIRLFNRSLTASQVQNLYFKGKPFEGEYEHVVDTGAVNNWTTVFVDASIPTETDIEATIEALDNTGTTIDTQSFTVNDGAMNYSVSLQDSEDARITFAGTSNDPERTWTVKEIMVYYYR